MSLTRTFALLSLFSVTILACSQGDTAGSGEEADASAFHEAADVEVIEASEAAREALARLDARLGSKARVPVRLRREGASLRVLVEGSSQDERATVELALRARDAFRIADEATKLEAYVSLKGASEARAEVAEGSVVYVGGMLGGGDLVHRPNALGTEDFILFDEAPPSERLEYAVTLGEKVAGLRLVEDVLELIDEGGAPRLRVASPYVVDAEGERHDASLSVEGCAVDTNPAAPWGRAPTAAGASSCTVVVDWRERGVSYPAIVDPSWEMTAGMLATRADHTASLLPNGRVLLAGGRHEIGYRLTAEIYDPGSRTWAATGSMAQSRSSHTATVLDGKSVLVTGGISLGALTTTYRSSAEIYDIELGTWSSTGAMNSVRYRHRAVLLEDGGVLVIGGGNATSSLKSIERYDPAAETFSPFGDTNSPRQSFEPVVLSDGKILLVGGYNQSPEAWLSSVELLDPATKQSTIVASIPGARAGHRAVLLLDGRALAFGGYNGASYLGSGAIYDPVANSWTSLPVTTPRSAGSLTLLGHGQVLVVGGNGNGGHQSTTQLYDVVSHSWTSAGSLQHQRGDHTATRLLNGDVLIAGGIDGSTYLMSAEVYKAPPQQTCSLGSQCSSGFCVDGYCCDSACDGGCGACNLAGSQGICRPLAKGAEGSPSCSPYLCGGTSAACPSSCASQADCLPSHLCSAGICKPKAPMGASCAADSECASGFCAGGVCCESACDGICEACTSGTCNFIAAGTPKAGCGYFVCDGKSGACPSSCESDAQCRSDAFCDNGSCQPKAKTGTVCQTDGECQSGFCTDGVCCEARCDGPCAQCNREGAVGSCVPAIGQPVGGRAPCASDGSLCGGSCAGDSLDCSYPAASTPCGGAHCEDGLASAEASCDGAGLCAPSDSRPCAPYGCGESDCKTSCETSSDCHAPAECVNGECKGTLDRGQACGSGGECQSGFCADGVCCNTACDEVCALCNVAGSVGVCLAQADTSEACRGKSDEGGESGGEWLSDDGGCGCRVAGDNGKGEGRALVASLAVVIAWGARRRGIHGRAR